MFLNRCRTLLVLACLALGASLAALAAIEERQFDTDEQAERYQRLADELRCPLCLNANLSGSDAPIAADLRQQIYEQIQAGRSDEEIIDFMTTRYGDFILYRPPVTSGTLLLWFGPPVLLLLGFFIIRRSARDDNETEAARLSPEEARKLEDYLSSSDRNS